jgi:hypothetical protein
LSKLLHHARIVDQFDTASERECDQQKNGEHPREDVPDQSRCLGLNMSFGLLRSPEFHW